MPTSNDEIERLRAENEKLQHWKALDKPLTAAMEIANSHVASMRAERAALLAALKTLTEHRRAGLTMPISDACWDQARAAIKLAEGE